tara:strand:+ start:9073 stop:9789 length:717 start_codon:yes stop_codon:yes gene_type:complete
MIVLSFDVGIRHLAYLLINSTTNKIMSWNSLDISQPTTCCQCESSPQYTFKEKLYCKQHIKHKTPMTKRLMDLQKSSITKQSEYLKKKSSTNTLLEDYIKEEVYHKLSTNANKLNLIYLGRNMTQHFNRLFNQPIDVVLIENQIGKIAIRMKSLQGMIAQYFIQKNVPTIEFISSKNKLHFIKHKTTYKERKQLGIDEMNRRLSEPGLSSWREYFQKHQKKDDLADSFLQYQYYIDNV